MSPNYFAVLGVQPVLGRGFAAEEATGRNAHPVTVISYRTFRERYHADPRIIGKTQVLNGLRHTIVGVAPAGFAGTFVGYAIEFWVPTSMQERFESGGVYKLEDRGARWIEGFARLRPGATREQAQAEIAAVAERLAAAYPATDRGRGVELLPLWRTPFNKAHELLPTLGITLVVVILGGSGSLIGSFVGSFVVGVLYNFGQAMFPELAYVILFLPMLVVLVVRPAGLFGRPSW